MASNPNNNFPSWGQSGSSPPNGFSYDAGDQVNEKHLDFLWDELNSLAGDIEAKWNAVDSNEDDVVSDAENVTATYKGNDIDSDGDGTVDAANDATNVTATYKGNDIDSNGDGKVDNADQLDGLDSSDFNQNPETLYGDGSDGSITDSSNINRSGIIRATDYTLQTGNTVTVPSGDGLLCIFATNSITISGTIDGAGSGGLGGAGGVDGNNFPANGEDSVIFPESTGGAGGSGSSQDGGDGGTGDPLGYRREALKSFDTLFADYDVVTRGAGAGGGGGGAGFSSGTSASGSNGTAPGGGGGGADDGGSASSYLGSGGDGGDGGAGVYLIAPDVTVEGTIDVSGTNGADGGSYAGGGGGGSGGVVFIAYESLTENTPTYTVSAGSGGLGSDTAGDGANGDAGATIKQQL